MQDKHLKYPALLQVYIKTQVYQAFTLQIELHC